MPRELQLERRPMDIAAAINTLPLQDTPDLKMTQTRSQPDWFARSTALLAIALTVIGLYFTNLTYNWQTKESLEERILVRLGYQRNVENSDGEIGVEIVNI